MQTTRHKLLVALAEAYERSAAGRTGVSARPFSIIFRELTDAANCADGDALVVATHAIRQMATDGLIRLRYGHRDLSVITKVELEAAGEARFYSALKRPSPTDRRHNLASIFRHAMALPVTDYYRDGWETMCANMAEVAENGGSVAPFCRRDDQGTEELLRASSQLLCWKTESLLRFASCQIFGNSKRLGELRGAIESVIVLVTGGEIKCLSELGILDNPRSCLISGPAILHFPDGVVDLRALQAPLTISIADIARCLRVETPALRFCTIENPTTFHELAKLGDKTLLACTDGYAGSALLAFMAKLPMIEKYHFGDSDPAGFDILADIRNRSGSQINSLHMAYRPAEKPEPLSLKDRSIAERVLASNCVTDDEKLQVQRIMDSDDKGTFEQEMLGIPMLSKWPFYLQNQAELRQNWRLGGLDSKWPITPPNEPEN